MDGIRNRLAAVLALSPSLFSFVQEYFAGKSELWVGNHQLPIAKAMNVRADKEHGVLWLTPLAAPVESGTDVLDRKVPSVRIGFAGQVGVQDLQLMVARDNRLGIDILHTAECDKDRLALLCSSELLARFDALPDFGFVV